MSKDWPEQDDGIATEDVIDALATLHGLGHTIHEEGFHHQRVIALYRMWFQDQVDGLSAMEGRRVLRLLVDDLNSDAPPPHITMIYQEMVAFDTAYLHELSLYLKRSALNRSASMAAD